MGKEAMTVKIKFLSNKAIMPTRATEGSVAYDVYAPDDIIIYSGRQVIPLQFAIELPNKYYEAKIEPRSGFSAKGMYGFAVTQNAGPKNDCMVIDSVAYHVCSDPARFDCDVLIGKIDSDYRGSVGVIVCNRDPRTFLIKAGTRIAQMTIYKTPETEFNLVEELSDTTRTGGFGHTGVSS